MLAIYIEMSGVANEAPKAVDITRFFLQSTG
jgi:hypothetical protein